MQCLALHQSHGPNLSSSFFTVRLILVIILSIFVLDFVDQVANKYYVGVSAFVKVQLKVRILINYLINKSI